MADKEEKKVTLQNRGVRHFDLKGGRVSPGEMVEVTAEEAKKLAGYRDLVDVSKLPIKGAAAAEAAKLKVDNKALADENALLKKQLEDAKKPKDKTEKDK